MEKPILPKPALSFRRGFIYTLCILLLASVLLELMAYQAEWTGRLTLDVQPPSDADLLGYRLNELTWLTQQAIGVNASLSRNSTALTLSIEDSGFPLINYTNGSVNAAPLQAWLQTNWTTQTHTTLTFNVTNLNNTGLDPVFDNQLLQTTSGINYSHINFYAANDMANLTLPNLTAQNLTLTLFCSRPANTSNIAYTLFSSSGSGMNGTVSYMDPALGIPYVTSALYSPSSNNSFAANYTDASGNWLQTIHADWHAPNYTLVIWDEANSSYSPPFNKWNVSCTWNISIILNDSNASADSLFIPVNTTLGYGNASTNQYLTIARE